MGKFESVDPVAVSTINQESEISTNQKKRNLNIATWNIRRGLITKENELILLLTTEDIDVIFLTETDTNMQNAKDFHVKGYTTRTQLCGETNQTIRILALTKDNCGVDIVTREDLMSEDFPSIWL